MRGRYPEKVAALANGTGLVSETLFCLLGRFGIAAESAQAAYRVLHRFLKRHPAPTVDDIEAVFRPGAAPPLGHRTGIPLRPSRCCLHGSGVSVCAQRLAVVLDCAAGLVATRDSGNCGLDLAADSGEARPSSSSDDEAAFDKHGVIGQDERRHPIGIASGLDEAIGPAPSIPYTLGCERLCSRDSV